MSIKILVWNLRLEAQGFSGGIWVFWRKEIVNVTPYDSHTQHVTILIEKLGEAPWLFSAIYASPNSTLRRDIWVELEKIKGSFQGPCLIAGDFNETSKDSERNGCGRSEMQRRCNEFANWIENNEFIDLGCSRPEHTWFSLEGTRLLLLNQLISIVDCTTGFAPISSSVKPFRFQAAWIHHEKFGDFVVANWNNNVPIVSFLKVFAEKLNLWNREIFHNIFRKKEELMARMAGIQRELSKRRNSFLIKLEASLRRQLINVLDQEETIWFRKSRLDAICDGDRNTRFFHVSTIIRRRNNRIETLQDSSGDWVTDHEQVKSMVLEYWRNFFQDETSLAKATG
ncbi:uncharacterized protein LOC110737202 [Chenopodium quinoa]|uniref:uncharacterized protein LOC110737202 n=1 Tax=Chenopodium quinoa TaxID=63459 RepID=UPI000B79A0CE|nr:uncharacterized protein LOC110737202 [Chenopodium quinoa]